MQKVTCCQPPKLVSFTVLLRQNTFCQVLHEWASPVLAGEHNVTFLSIYHELAGPTLDLDLICIFTHTWPVEACPLKSVVKADLPAGSASLVVYFFQFSLGLLLPYTSGQDPTWHPTAPLSPGRSLLVSLILRRLLLSSRLPLWGSANPLRTVPPGTFPSTS